MLLIIKDHLKWPLIIDIQVENLIKSTRSFDCNDGNFHNSCR